METANNQIKTAFSEIKLEKIINNPRKNGAKTLMISQEVTKIYPGFRDQFSQLNLAEITGKKTGKSFTKKRLAFLDVVDETTALEQLNLQNAKILYIYDNRPILSDYELKTIETNQDLYQKIYDNQLLRTSDGSLILDVSGNNIFRRVYIGGPDQQDDVRVVFAANTQL